MPSSLSEAVCAAPRAAGLRPRAWLRDRRVLAAAVALSLALHLVLSSLPAEAPASPEDVPLTATIQELPPPPTPVTVAPTAAPSAPRKAARRTPAIATAPRNAAAPAIAAPTSEPIEPAGENGRQGDAEKSAAEAPPALAEDVPSPGSGEVSDAKTLPPRIDLAYKVFLGTQGFQIGEATYRFEHADNRYRISTVGQARGLAALFVRGQGRVESRGLITAGGLQPLEFSVDRFNRRGRESALFDWETGIVTLPDSNTAALETPTFDPLSLMWQYYFTPPEGDRLTINLATTKRVARYLVTREGRESIEWHNGTIETERWARRSDDGRTEAYAWLAPSLRYIPVKMRVSSTGRGTLEALLDAIRVDETGATVGRDDVPLEPAPVEATPMPGGDAGGYRPGATFPTMTGQ